MTQTQTRSLGLTPGRSQRPSTYVFFKLDLLQRRLLEEERRQGKRELLRTVEEHKGAMLLRSFSLMGLRSDAEFILWRIGYDLEAFEEMQGALMKTGLGKSALLTEI